MTLEERIEVTRIHSVAGLTGQGTGLAHERPFRAPHASATYAALVGGGNPIRPGEVGLAHRGVLFLDETPEFGRQALEALRAPIEDRRIVVSRAGRKVCFPTSVSLVCAMNPCPCGHRDDPSRECRCTPRQVDGYRRRLSGPLLDRIDIQVALEPVTGEELAAAPSGDGSDAVRERVMQARARQLVRNGANAGGGTNAEISVQVLDRVAALGEAELAHLSLATRLLGLTARSWHRVIRVARTIADLGGRDEIRRADLSEALTYRVLDRANAPRRVTVPRARSV